LYTSTVNQFTVVVSDLTVPQQPVWM